MSDPYVGEIRCFGFNFAPQNWAQCAGQLLPIAQNAALFSVLGTTYGGDGKTTFGLPDLQGRTPVGMGLGPGLANVAEGQKLGEESVTLLASQLPAHSHTLDTASNGGATLANAPTANVSFVSQYQEGNNKGFLNMFVPSPPPPAKPVTMAAASLAPSGSGQPHENRQPYLAIGFCMALTGVYPSRS